MESPRDRGPRGEGPNVNLMARVEELIASNKVMIFSKSFCPFCKRVKELFDSLNEPYFALELDIGDDSAAIQQYLSERTGIRTVPNVFVSTVWIGGCDATLTAHANGKLKDLLAGMIYDYDLIVIGGGSGGLSASKEAAILGKRVLVCDYVVPSPKGTTWGLGGTCVNVGCIPKKLMHRAAIIGHDLKDEAQHFGWEVPDLVFHNWKKMVENIQMYIKSLNFGYRKALREKNVIYKNTFAKFVNRHTVQITEKLETKEVTANHFIIACGGRPNYPCIPGALEYGITSDDLFSLKYHPGKCLIVGASYIALECAGFLKGIGIDVTVMVRSILLRGFDQQLAEMVGDHMKNQGIKFIRPCVPTKIEEINDGEPGLYKVYAQMTDTEEVLEDEYNTIIFAVGRTACTAPMNLGNAGVTTNQSNGKIPVNEREQTSVSNIYAIGDVIEGKLELTPVAIQAGLLLARRLYGGSSTLMDYTNVPTTVFTPLEYGFVGLSEEDAMKRFGDDNVEVFHSFYNPLEYALSKRDENKCYGKLVCVRSQENRVVGFHVLGPNAGEITQGYAIGIKLGATQSDFANLVGIHPTDAEIFTTMSITKASGLGVEKTGC